jgi:polyhydroxyalkanoate synthesis repressor PhaR
MPDKRPEASPVLIKRYAGRRLYNTVTSTYLSFDDLSDMILRGQRFVVLESETGEDITRDILDRLH